MRVAALLRGISSSKRISMPALREIVESLGHRDVETYQQSGNVVHAARGGRKDLGRKLESAIAKETGLDVRVLVRTGRELAGVVSANLIPSTT